MQPKKKKKGACDTKFKVFARSGVFKMANASPYIPTSSIKCVLYLEAKNCQTFYFFIALFGFVLWMLSFSQVFLGQPPRTSLVVITSFDNFGMDEVYSFFLCIFYFFIFFFFCEPSLYLRSGCHQKPRVS